MDDVYVVEEASTYLSDAVRAAGIALSETPHEIPRDGELSPASFAPRSDAMSPLTFPPREDLPARPPALCAGCPHRLVFKELSRLRAIVTGDIGCYTPRCASSSVGYGHVRRHGASISMAHGFELAFAGSSSRPVVAVIGDSTFAHSGLSSLISTVYNCGTVPSACSTTAPRR